MASTIAEHELTPYASHMSLFLGDAGADAAETDYSAWTTDEVEALRILAAPHELQIATARDDRVPVRLRVLSAPLALEPGASHVAEVDLSVPSGRVLLRTVDDDDLEVAVQLGLHRVRVTYLPRTTPLPQSNEDQAGDHYEYLVELWPVSQPTPSAVIVQGPRVWAG